MNQSSPSVKPQTLKPWLLVVLVVLIVAAAVYWYFTRNQTKSSTAAPGPTATATVKPSTTPTATATVSGYTDNIYKFSFNYPASWGACKVKQAQVTGTTMTFYINCPTVDKSFAAGDSLQFPGYYSPLAISVFTPAQWADNQQIETEKDSLITQNNTYMFGWIQANGQLPSDWTNTMFNNYQPLLDSFKLN